jgi:hypothetical protein
MVVHACNLSYSRSRDWEDHSLSQPGQKVDKTPISTNKIGIVVVRSFNPSYARSMGRRITAEADSGKK